MTKERYVSNRKALLSEAEALIEAGKLEEFEAKKAEIEALDDQFDNEAKAAANLRALSDNPWLDNAASRALRPTGSEMLSGLAEATEDLYDSTEYRKAFMDHVIHGAALPAPFVDADQSTKTTDIPAVIPTTVMARIVEKMESTGMILPLVTRTAYKGGVKIPTSTVKPTAVWVAEGKGSDRQKKTTGAIDFAYNKLRCAISVSLETDTMALSVFESVFISNVTEAMTRALEQSIVSGTGSGQPKGFLTETPADGQALTLAPGDKLSYQTLIEAEAALPLAYENGAAWFMTKKTFMGFVGMVDSNKQPIARVNTGLSGRPERTLLGRTVVLNDYMPSYADTMAETGVIAALFDPKDYILNTNLNMTIKRYEDNDTDDQVTKAVLLADGKVVDKHSLVTLTKAASGA